MKPVSQLFSQNDRERVADAIGKAELKTSAEIVTVAATASGRYDRAEDIFGFLVAIVAVVAGWLTCPAFHAQSVWEGSGPSWAGLVPVLIAMIAGFAGGSALASQFPVLRLPFIPARELEEECLRGAQAAFMSSKVRKTAAGTGLMIYISFYEHRVVALPDDTIAEKLPPETWQEVCDLIVAGMKSGSPVKALEDAVIRAGDILGDILPREEDDEDELSNELILLD
jgi:putative membrane protein